jgi:thymidylate synthase (FAD)|tara:strand:- start:93 stop:464 length:372 start_codon:yes stop_codon:yes gene_type:complete
VSDNPEFYRPDEWRGKSDDKKQGSAGVVEVEDVLEETHGQALVTYQELLDKGVCPEQARMVLPQSTMTEWYWSGSLDAFADMVKLRVSGDTQKETRDLAWQIDEAMLKLFPVSWDALVYGDDK